MIRVHLRFNLVALIALGCGYESAVPFPHPHDAAPEAAAPAPDTAVAAIAADAGADLTLPADARGEEAALAADSGSPADTQAGETAATCESCYAEAAGTAPGSCKVARPNACEAIPPEGVGMKRDPGDRALCQALDDCMKATKCWADSGPSACLCGTTGVDCGTTAANGACKAQVMAATKAANEQEASLALFDPWLPASFAAQKYSCYGTTCKALCK
jgi:hypothetical protein